MAFRVGRTEKEGWYNALQIEGAHDQTIYSIDWIEAEDYDSAASGTADKDATKDLGRIASVGGDGKLCVFSIVSRGTFIPSSAPFLLDLTICPPPFRTPLLMHPSGTSTAFRPRK